MPDRITVFHCDDSAAFTHLVRLWLEEYDGIEHVGAAHSGAAALDAVRECAPDVVLLDTMGAPGDPALLNAIRAAAPRARVLVYSGYVSMMRPKQLGAGA